MENKQLVLNTLIYADQIKNLEMTQIDCLDKAKKLGFVKVEVRRELFSDLTTELTAIAHKAKELGLEIFYSIPEGLFINHELNPILKTHLEEAKLLNATHVKWNLGEFANYQDDFSKDIAKLKTNDLIWNVENDQSQTGGLLPAVVEFGKRFLENNPIGYVYDLGNWEIMGFDPVVAAEELKSWTTYIHLKDVAESKVVPLGKGTLATKEVLEVLPSDLPIAFEFRIKEDSELEEAMQHLNAIQ